MKAISEMTEEEKRTEIAYLKQSIEYYNDKLSPKQYQELVREHQERIDLLQGITK